MSDDVVICKGRVVSVSAYQRVDDGIFNYDLEYVHSNLALDQGVFSTDVDVTSQISMTGAVYNTPKLLTVRGKLEFGQEYEFIMRPVKQSQPALQTTGGTRLIKEEE